MWEGTTNKTDKRRPGRACQKAWRCKRDSVPGCAPLAPPSNLSLGRARTSWPLEEGESLLSQQKSFLFHSPVLEPDLDLLVTKVQAVREFPPALACDELVDQKFALQLSQLQLRVGLALLSGAAVDRVPGRAWVETKCSVGQRLRGWLAQCPGPFPDLSPSPTPRPDHRLLFSFLGVLKAFTQTILTISRFPPGPHPTPTVVSIRPSPHSFQTLLHHHHHYHHHHH